MILNGHKLSRRFGPVSHLVSSVFSRTYEEAIEDFIANSLSVHFWTFDDCHLDLMRIHSELFEPRKIGFKFFVSPKLIDAWSNGEILFVRSQLRDSTAKLLGWDQVNFLLDKGHLLGLHGYDHSDFLLLSDSEIVDQHESSIQLLKDRTGISTDSFALPFGRVSSASACQVSRLMTLTKSYFRKIYLSDNHFSPGASHDGLIVNRRHAELGVSLPASVAKGALQCIVCKSFHLL